MKLTAKKVERVKAPGRYFDGHGLYLQVVNSNNKSWLLRFERDGRERWLGLGPLHTYNLKEARERARDARQLLHSGIDPIEHRKAAKAAQALAAAKTRTFKECAEAYIVANRGAWRSAKHGAQWSATLKTYVYPTIGNLPVAAIDTGLVLKCIELIWKDKTETASRVRGRIESVLDWATVRNYRSGDNPARWRGYLEHVLPQKNKVSKVEHHAALPYAELPAFMQALRQRKSTAVCALEFTILTAARTAETTGARWGEIDFAAKTWVVPASRMKGGKEHRIPLAPRVIELLRGLYREEGNDFIFIGSQSGRGLSDSAMVRMLQRMGRSETTHGFRSAFSDWAHEQTAHSNHTIELSLAHAVGSDVEKAYRRGTMTEKRRKLMEQWAAYCTSPPVAATGATVVALRA
jgi:integrase